MNKTQVKKLLVEERKGMREKAKHSKFMAKTASIYRGQVTRAEKVGVKLPYTLAHFRDVFRADFPLGCIYTGEKLTLSNVAVDHRTPLARGGDWTLSNLRLCTQSANWQKGILTAEEFGLLMTALKKMPDQAATDVKRRLTTGGKWLAKRF